MLILYPNIQMDMYQTYCVKDIKWEISSSNSGHGLGWRATVNVEMAVVLAAISVAVPLDIFI